MGCIGIEIVGRGGGGDSVVGDVGGDFFLRSLRRRDFVREGVGVSGSGTQLVISMEVRGLASSKSGLRGRSFWALERRGSRRALVVVSRLRRVVRRVKVTAERWRVCFDLVEGVMLLVECVEAVECVRLKGGGGGVV